ncbi:hypothetical protein JCM19000A_07060 [Silvimonas sp. JCM 19000]
MAQLPLRGRDAQSEPLRVSYLRALRRWRGIAATAGLVAFGNIGWAWWLGRDDDP